MNHTLQYPNHLIMKNMLQIRFCQIVFHEDTLVPYSFLRQFFFYFITSSLLKFLHLLSTQIQSPPKASKEHMLGGLKIKLLTDIAISQLNSVSTFYQCNNRVRSNRTRKFLVHMPIQFLFHVIPTGQSFQASVSRF